MSGAKYIYEDDAVIVESYDEIYDENTKNITAKSNPKSIIKLEYIEETGKMHIHTNNIIEGLTLVGGT